MIRSPQGIGLTDAGHRLAEATRSGFGRIAQALRAERQGRETRLRITTTTFITDAVILPQLGGFWDAHPEIELSFAPSIRLVDIEAEGFDIAIRTSGVRRDGDGVVHLMTCPVIAVASPSLVQAGTDWSKIAWVGHTAPWVELVMRDFGLASARFRDVENPAMEVEAAKNSIGPAVGSEIVFRSALREGSLVRLPLETRELAHYYALINPGSRSKELDAFMEWLRAVFAAAEAGVRPD